MKSPVQATVLLLLTLFTSFSSAATCNRSNSLSALAQIQNLIAPGIRDGSVTATTASEVTIFLQNLDSAITSVAGTKVKRQVQSTGLECNTEEKCLATTSSLICWNIHSYTARDQFGNSLNFHNGDIRLYDGTSWNAINNPLSVKELKEKVQAAPKAFWNATGGSQVLTTATMTFTGPNGMKATTTMTMASTATSTPGKSSAARNGEGMVVVAVMAAVMGGFMLGMFL
ncbi:hypothetical protein EX30DRAFT_369300 [Ascodesmis nigricans]|uniref:Uncharacterized protein n=1 Tax=Ascodesmis nigricans TaxID=341454 RepID=A0A4S2N4D8_9PEZI|nr:hypothetical protein EX30DRAFT_369300 [Ascodesmis nigricans]